MKLPIPLLALALAAAALPSPAEESVEDIYNRHCVSCHGPEVYTRTDRKVTSLPGLERQVQRCELALGLKWFDEDIAGMARYLNEHYYRFQP